MIRIRSLIALVALVGMIPACGGWYAAGMVMTGAAAGATKAYENGSMRDFEATPEQTYKAVQDELKENWPQVVVSNKPELKDGTADFEIKNGHIKIDPHVRYKQYTRINVKIGTFDSKEKSEALKKFLDSVGKRLGE